MSKDELVAKLRLCAQDQDAERAHDEADEALLEYINDPVVTEAFKAVEKWYA